MQFLHLHSIAPTNHCMESLYTCTVSLLLDTAWNPYPPAQYRSYQTLHGVPIYLLSIAPTKHCMQFLHLHSIAPTKHCMESLYTCTISFLLNTAWNPYTPAQYHSYQTLHAVPTPVQYRFC